MRKLFVFVFIIFCFSGFAQSELKFHTLSPKGGLSYDGILDIKQDGRGFMWIVLESNLFRFDGYTYKSFKTQFQSGINASAVYFNNIALDSKGNLYVSARNGLYKFNYDSDHFSNIIKTPMTQVYVDTCDVFWLITSKGIAMLGKNDEVIYPDFNGKKYPLHNRIFCESNKDLYLFSRFGQIYRYNRTNSTMEDCVNIHHDLKDADLIDAKIYNNELWVLTSKCTILRIDLTTHLITLRYNNPDLQKINIRCMNISENADLWIGSMNGLYVLNLKNSQIRRYQHNPTESFCLPHNSIWTIWKDKQNNMWIGTYMGSVVYVNRYDEKIFETYYHSQNGLNKVPVSGFAYDSKNLWISTEGGGVNVFQKKERRFTYLQQNESQNSLSSNYTKALVTDKSGNIWISTFRGVLNRYNPQNKHFTHYKNNPKNKNSLLFNDLRKIVLETDSGLWVAYLQHTASFSFLSFKNKLFTHYSIDNKGNSFTGSDYIYDIYKDRNNKLWLLTSYSLYSFDVRSKQLAEHRIPSANKVIASTLCMDHTGKIWIGTFGNELVSFEPETQTFQSFPHILQSDIAEIYSINYSNGGVWIGTNDGLYLFNIETNNCSIFKESDGTQGNVYYPLATIKGENGLLYFGGAGGLTIVNPEKVRFNPVKPKAVISDFYIDNTSVLGKRKASLNADFANNTPQLVLSHKEQNFGFKISSDNYLNANKNQFRYRLKNFDNRWILADASGRIIHYSKIPPGNYFFEFQTANNDGIWGDISSVKIIRKRAPWFSIPAVLLYFFLFSAMVYYLVSTYKKRKQLELQHYLDQIEKEKKEEIHKNQLQFFTNISHDLKTPLSLIMATVNRMREEGMKEYYYKILNNNSERLMQMLSEILDFRKIQNNKMKLKVSNGNLNEFLQVISSGFHEYAANKCIDFQIKNTDNSLAEIPFDKKIMEKIVLNLLNNAFKYTPKGGTIKITASQQEFDSEYSTSFTIENKSIPPSNSFFQLTVSDTGVGISKESIVKVFDRFYRVETKNESAHLGTGIGLALVKDLVLLHKGSITICSERNIGTDFILRFSMLPSYYRPDEIWIAEESVAVQQEHQTGFSSDSSTPELVVENKSQSINEFKHIEKSISKKPS